MGDDTPSLRDLLPIVVSPELSDALRASFSKPALQRIGPAPSSAALQAIWRQARIAALFYEDYGKTHEPWQTRGTEPGPLAVWLSSERHFLLALNAALDAFLSLKKEYELKTVRKIERFRTFVEKRRWSLAGASAASANPRLRFGLNIDGFHLVDSTNKTFAVQCEVSVGVPLVDALEYFRQAHLAVTEERLREQITLDGVIVLDGAQRDLLEALLKIRMRSGVLEEQYSYFRFGSSTEHIWLIQDVSAKVYHDGGFKNFPFDSFSFVADFNVGLGGDVVNVELEIGGSVRGGESLFSRGFDAGEFRVDLESARLAALGFLEDETHYVENIARLTFTARRPPGRTLARVVLPLLLMVAIVVARSFWADDVKELRGEFIPTMFVAIVALQLTANQGMPRDAYLSPLDRWFILSYLLAVVLFILFLLAETLKAVHLPVLLASGLYTILLLASLGQSYLRWRSPRRPSRVPR
jgi:hypothetical protein